jgi:hypothetical protein
MQDNCFLPYPKQGDRKQGVLFRLKDRAGHGWTRSRCGRRHGDERSGKEPDVVDDREQDVAGGMAMNVAERSRMWWMTGSRMWQEAWR